MFWPELLLLLLLPLGHRGAALAAITLVVYSVEAPFIKRMCGVNWRRALLASMTVNVVSTLLGVAVWPAIAALIPHLPSPGVLIFVLGPLTIAFAILVEFALLARFLACSRRRRFGTAVAMNLVSHVTVNALTLARVFDSFPAVSNIRDMG